MLTEIDPNTFVYSMFLVIGGVFALAGLFVFTMVSMTTVRCLWSLRQRRQAERTWRATFYRTDGKPYPAYHEGTCLRCGRGDRKIYWPPDIDLGLCPKCYEGHWRAATTESCGDAATFGT